MYFLVFNSVNNGPLSFFLLFSFVILRAVAFRKFNAASALGDDYRPYFFLSLCFLNL